MNILCVKPKFETAVSYYRGATVLHELCRVNGWNLDVLPIKDITQDQIHKYDILYDTRPTSDDAIYCIYLAKNAGVKVWVDIDDLLWQIPGANTVSRTFTEKSKSNLTRSFLNADIVTASTDELAELISKEFGVQCISIPNAWNDRVDYLPEQWNAPEPNAPAHIFWRGSTTHTGDLLIHREYFKESDQYYFTFMGEFPTFFFKKYGGGLDRINWQSWRNNIFEYFNLTNQLKPQFFFFPLEDNPFNRCKSNIAFIEATMCGAVCIASPTMPEFTKTPSILLDTTKDSILIEEYMEKAPSLYRESVLYLDKVLRLSLINKRRALIAKALYEKR